MSYVAGVTGRQKIAVIGAGLAGLSCAGQLANQGHDVRLFDKARGPGGRMSTRRFTTPQGDAVADHGAQYFTARDPAFQAEVDEWAARDIVTQWPDIADDAWIGKPSMNAIIRHLAAPLDVQWNCRAEALMRSDKGWFISGLPTDEIVDAVILAIPSEQALTFLAQHDFDMARKAMLARFQPCWTVLLAFDHPLATDKKFIRDVGAIGWAAREGAKPGRLAPASGVDCWVVQASASWSAAHLEDEAEQVVALMQTALGEALSLPLPQPIAQSTHRWRYAMSSGLGEAALWNPALGLGVCGDWLLGPRIECAWLSGRALAAQIATEQALATA